MAMYHRPEQSSNLILQDQQIYGSSREAVLNRNLVLNTATLPTTHYSHRLGDKQFQISNHLGNVLSTFSDHLKKDNGGSGSTVLAYKPIILSVSTYSSFGAPLEDGSTNWSNESYRYGFNGMEKDDEMKGAGNSYDFGARIYDPRLGYFLSIDPLTRKYASQSPYVYAANSPLRYIDLHGMGPADAAKSGMSAAVAAASNKSGQASNSGSGNANAKQPKSATQWVKTIATTANQKSQTASNNTASNNTSSNNTSSNNNASNKTTSNATTSQSLSQRVTNIVTENTPTGTSSSASNNTNVALTGNETPAQSNTMPWTGETTSASVTTFAWDFKLLEPLGGVSVQSTTTTVVDGETGVFNYNKTTNEKGEISHDVSLNTPISSTTIGTNGSGLNVSQTYFGYGGSQGIGITENYSLEVSFGLIWPNENGSSQETSVSFRANPVVVASIVFAPYAGGLGASLARLVTR